MKFRNISNICWRAGEFMRRFVTTAKRQCEYVPRALVRAFNDWTMAYCTHSLQFSSVRLNMIRLGFVQRVTLHVPISIRSIGKTLMDIHTFNQMTCIDSTRKFLFLCSYCSRQLESPPNAMCHCIWFRCHYRRYYCRFDVKPMCLANELMVIHGRQILKHEIAYSDR